MTHCSFCGGELSDGARFCMFCGQQVNSNSDIQNNDAVTSSIPTPIAIEAQEATDHSNKVLQIGSSADEIIAYLRDYLGIDAEKTEDGGVRITKRRYNEDIGMYELRLAVTPMTTPSGHTVKGISLPEGVTEIADQAFYMAWELEYIKLPSTLRKIGVEAFSDSELVEVVIPEGVTEIGEAAFAECMHLKKATVKCSMRVIPPVLFISCDELEEVILPANLEEIEDNAFEQCFKLKKLKLPARLKNVGRGAFYECPDEAIRQVKAAFPDYKE